MVSSFGCVDLSFENGVKKLIGGISAGALQPPINDVYHIVVCERAINMPLPHDGSDILFLDGVGDAQSINRYLLFHRRYESKLKASFLLHPSASADRICCIAFV